MCLGGGGRGSEDILFHQKHRKSKESCFVERKKVNTERAEAENKGKDRKEGRGKPPAPGHKCPFSA